LSIRGQLYTLTISPERLHLVRKGRRKGYELAWIDLISGDAALATALNASLAIATRSRTTTKAQIQRDDAQRRPILVSDASLGPTLQPTHQSQSTRAAVPVAQR